MIAQYFTLAQTILNCATSKIEQVAGFVRFNDYSGDEEFVSGFLLTHCYASCSRMGLELTRTPQGASGARARGCVGLSVILSGMTLAVRP